MAAAENTPSSSPPSESIKAPPTEALATKPTTPAKVPRPPATPEQLARTATRIDMLLAGLVVVFAFLVSCFPAYNADLFQQFATGRLVAHGSYPFGSDPYSYVSEGYTVNHSWLFGLVAYLIYETPGHEIGGTVLTFLKAALVAALAALLLRTARRHGQSLWVPTCCVFLAVLSFSWRVFLQPSCLSMILLGVTLFLLRRPRQLREERGALGVVSFRSFWLLPVLCALWVNVDVWFLLGPITIGLYLVGDLVTSWLRRSQSGDDAFLPGEVKALSITLAASLLACLVNPHHVFAFVLPTQLGLTEIADLARDDLYYHQLFISPFDTKEYLAPGFGYSVAGISYYLLFAVGVISFLAAGYGSLRSGRVVPGWRITLWIFFSILSGWHARAIPFFAVIIGPIMALNFADFAALLPSKGATRDTVAGRWLTVMAGVFLCVLAIPGWLQGEPQRQRHFGWGVVPDPSFAKLNEEIKKLLDDGKLPTDLHWFNTTPDALSYLVWFCPGQKGFLDARLNVPPVDAEAYFKAKQALNSVETGEQAEKKQASTWRNFMRDYQIRYIIHAETNVFSPSTMQIRFLAFPDEWVVLGPLFAKGKASVYGWDDPKAAELGGKREDKFAGLRQDLYREAFGVDCVPPPSTGPTRKPYKPDWYEALWRVEQPQPIEAQEAALYLLEYRLLGNIQRGQLARNWNFMTKQSVVSSLAVGSLGFVVVRGSVPMQHVYEDDFDEGPVPALYLALRAARQALKKNPDDALTYLKLGEVYHALQRQTRERWNILQAPNQKDAQIVQRYGSPELTLVRQTQALAALNQAVELNPDLIDAHKLLVEIYLRLLVIDQPPATPATRGARRLRVGGFQDLHLKHLQEVARLVEARGVLPGEKPDNADRRLTDMRRVVDEFTRALEKQKNRFAIEEQGKSTVDRALVARNLGLAETAVDVLMKAKPEDREGSVGAFVLIDLLLDIGQVDAAREALSPTFKEILGPLREQRIPAYEWLRIRLEAASGNYEEVDDALAEALKHQRGPGRQIEVVEEAAGICQIVVPALIPDALQVSGLGVMALPVRVPWKRMMMSSRQVAGAGAVREAELLLLRGWLALEAGSIKDARRYFEEALALRTPGLRSYQGLGLSVGPTGAIRVAEVAGLGERMEFRGSGLAQIALGWIGVNESQKP